MKIKTDSKLAVEWAADERTIRRWRKAGAPFGKRKAMFSWLASRKHIPAGTAALVDQQVRATTAAIASEPEDPKSSGAAAALRRLEQAEKVTYRLLEEALKSGNAAAIKGAREGWLKVGDSLRRYDLLVERDRRDSGELVPRAEVEKHVANYMHDLFICHRLLANTLGPSLVGLDAVSITEAIERSGWSNLLSLVAMGSMASCEAALPKWFLDAAIKALKRSIPTADETIRERQAMLEELFSELVSAGHQLHARDLVARKFGVAKKPDATENSSKA